MNQRFEELVDKISVHSPLQAMFRRHARNKLAVLAYHAVEDPDGFADQLDFIKQACRPVSFEEVLDGLVGRAPLPDRAVLVTFDDADATVTAHARPLLVERGIPAVAFVVASALDTDKPLWTHEARDLVRGGGTAIGVTGSNPDAVVRRMKMIADDRRLAVLDELRRTASGPARPVAQLRSEDLAGLRSAGIEIGNHTMTHPCLDRCSDARIADEIGGAHQTLVAAGVEPRAFAYPNGNAGARVAAHVAAHGYEAAFLFDHRLSPWPASDRFAISRLRVNSSDKLDRFRAVISGLHPAFFAVRARAGAQRRIGVAL